MKTKTAKDWCRNNHGDRAPAWKKDSMLSPEQVQWIMDEEGDKTLLMKKLPAIGGYMIRQGHYVTLAEVFYFGAWRCSCWDLYRTYLSLKIFIRKKPHSQSTTEPARLRQNAKKKRHEDTGNWGLSW